MLSINIKDETIKSSASQTSSLEQEAEQSKKAIVELSNRSVLHGYDMAIDLLLTQNYVDAAKLLTVNKGLIEIGLNNATATTH